MKVLYVFDKLGIGGTEKSGLTFIEYLDKKKLCDAYICAFFDKGDVFNEVKDRFKKVFFCDSNFLYLKNFIIKNKIDIVHINRSNNNFYQIEKFIKTSLTTVKIVETNHFGKTLEKEKDNCVDFRIFVSNFVAMRYIKLKKINVNSFFKKNTVVYNPISIKYFHKFTKEEILSFRNDLGINKKEVVIAKYGRKDNLKIDPILINTAKILVKNKFKFKFILVGAPEGIKKLIERKKLSEYFVFIEKIIDKKELNKLISSIDFLLHASLIGETFGYVYVESMFYRKVVVTNATPLFDNAQIEIIKNGVNGYIKNTPSKMARQIMDLASNDELYNQISTNAQKFVKNNFDVEKLSHDLLKIYNSLIGKKEFKENKYKIKTLKEFLKNYNKNKFGNEKESLVTIFFQIRSLFLKKYYSFLNK